MRYVLVVVGCLLTVSAFSQEKDLFQTRYSHQVVKYIDHHLGKRVGNGVCGTLTSKIMKKTKTEMAFKFMLKKKNMDYIAIGDFIWFTGTRKVDNPKHRYAPKQEWIGSDHIAVVVAKLDENTLVIAHQNVGVDKLDDSRVVLSLLSADDPDREELMAVMGMLPRKKGFDPNKLLDKSGKSAALKLDAEHRGYVVRVPKYEAKSQQEVANRKKF